MNVNLTWKKALICTTIVGVLAGGSYYAGRESRPDEVSYKTIDDYKWDLKLKDKSVSQEHFTFDWSKTTGAKANTKTTKTVIEKPTGEKITTETTETVVQVDTKEENKGAADLNVHKDVSVEDKGEHIQTADLSIKNNSDKKWSLTAGAEVGLRDLRHLSIDPTYYLGVSRHVVTWGPVDLSAGVNVVSDGAIVAVDNKAVLAFIEGSVSF